MKSLMDKFSADGPIFEFLLLLIPFILWIFCFLNFLNGRLILEADATSYADHICFYIDNLSRGVFPLWDPTWFNGAPNDFFLRRIGDVNPLLFLMVVLKWAGVSLTTAYFVFSVFYYFLAGWAMYLITRFLLKDRFFGFTAYILFLFSSWGFEIFYNYIIIIFVPIIWFFYFLLRFGDSLRQVEGPRTKALQKGFFLGLCLCLGLGLTTYIPFYFVTILAIFFLGYVLFYGRELLRFLQRAVAFFSRQKLYTFFCIFFLLSSCVPALQFYKESKGGEFVLPGRHSGADTTSAVAVGLDNAASGDIISHGYFDRIFDDHADMDLGDIYIPYLFFLLLLSTVCARVNKLIFFLLFNILALSLITITSAAGVHRFLFEHVLFFKFIRQIYYFFWLAMLPMGILLSVAAFKSLLEGMDASSHKRAWLVYIIVCHIAFVFYLLGHGGVLWGAWAAILISLLFFVVYFCYQKRISHLAGLCLFLIAVFVQSAQVCAFMEKKLFQMQQTPATVAPNPKAVKLNLYYASSWFTILVDTVDPQILNDYRSHPFMLFDNVVPCDESAAFLKTLQQLWANDINIAFLPAAESKPEDYRRNIDAGPQANMDPVTSGGLTINYADANTWILKTHLSSSQFLVINDNYNKDWHAFINGRQAHLFRANVAFKGLWIPAGESSVLLRFSTPKRYALHFGLIFLFMGTFLYSLILLRKGRQSASHG